MNNITPFGFLIKKSPAIVPVNEDFRIKGHDIINNAEKQFIELLLIESVITVIAKIQLEVDQSIDALFPDESQDIRIALKGTNREMKKSSDK